MMQPSALESGQWEIASIASPVDRESIRFGLWSRHAVFRRAVVFLNGRSEWIEKYAFLPHSLGLADDCAFLTMDHRGQGGSGGARAHVARFQDYVDDVKAVIAEALGTIPYAMMAHSMGGLIANFGTLKGDLTPSSLALSSPLFRLPDHPIPRRFSLPVSHAVQLMRMGHRPTGANKGNRGGFANNPLTQSPEAYRLMQNTPYKMMSPTFSWVAEVFRATGAIFQETLLAKRHTPTLVLGGSDERVIDAAAFSEWVQKAAKLSSAPVRYLLIQGGRHELFNEMESLREKALAEVRQWLHTDTLS